MAVEEPPNLPLDDHLVERPKTRRRKLIMIFVPLIILTITVVILLIYCLRSLRKPKPVVEGDLFPEPLNYDDNGNAGVLFREPDEVISKLENYTIPDELQAHFERDFMPPYDIALIKSASFRPRLGLMLLMECAMNESYIKNDPLLPSVADIAREHMPIRTYVPGSASGNMPWGIPGVNYRAGSIQETASEIRTRSDDRESNAISHFSHYFDQARMMHGISVEPPPPIGIRMFPSYALQFWDPSTFNCQEYADWLYYRFDQSELYETISRDLWKILEFRRGRENSENEFASLNFDSWHEFLLEDPHQRYLCAELSQVYFENCTEADAKFRDHFKMFLQRPRSAVWFMLTRWSFHLVSCRIMAKTMAKYRLIPENSVLRPMAGCYKDNLGEMLSCLDALPKQVKWFWGDSIDSPISVFVKNRLRWKSEQYHFLGAREMWSSRGNKTLNDVSTYNHKYEEKGELVINIPLAKYLFDLVSSSQIVIRPSEPVDISSESIRAIALELSSQFHRIVSIEPTMLVTDLRKYTKYRNFEINLDIEYAEAAIQHYDSYLLYAILSSRHDDLSHILLILSQANVTSLAFSLPLIHDCYRELNLGGVQQALAYLTLNVDQLDIGSAPDFIRQTLLCSQCYQNAIQMLLEVDRPPEDLLTATISQRLIICFLLSQIVAYDKLKELKELLPVDFVIYSQPDNGWAYLAQIPTTLPGLPRIQQLLAGCHPMDYESYSRRLIVAQKTIEILRMNSDDQQRIFTLLDWYHKVWTEHLGKISVEMS